MATDSSTYNNKPAKMTTRNAAGNVVSTIHDTIGRLADAMGLDPAEIAWAIEEEGVCDIEGPWPGQTTTIEEWNG